MTSNQQFAGPTWTCPNCGCVDDFSVRHEELPQEGNRVVTMIECHACSLKCTDARSESPVETPAPQWLLDDLAELRDKIQGTVGNDYARDVENIMAQLQSPVVPIQRPTLWLSHLREHGTECVACYIERLEATVERLRPSAETTARRE